MSKESHLDAYVGCESNIAAAKAEKRRKTQAEIPVVDLTNPEPKPPPTKKQNIGSAPASNMGETPFTVWLKMGETSSSLPQEKPKVKAPPPPRSKESLPGSNFQTEAKSGLKVLVASMPPEQAAAKEEVPRALSQFLA